MSGRPEIPQGEDVLMEGAFDPGVWRREAWVSAIVVAAVGLLVLVVWMSLFVLVAVAAMIVFFFGWALWEHRGAQGRRWALTERALYLSDGPPLPLDQIGRMQGTSNHVRLRRRDGRRLVLLGEAQAIALRARIRSLRAGGRA